MRSGRARPRAVIPAALEPAAAVRAEKAVVRARQRALRAALSWSEQTRAATAVAVQLDALPRFRSARVVAGYVPVRGELDPRPALARVRARGGLVAWPALCCCSRELRFALAPDDTGFVPGRFGVPAPPAHAPLVPAEVIDCLLVPGLAFDAAGRRLGQGGGYYDALLQRLSRLPGTWTVGLAHRFQLLPRVPSDAADLPVDLVIAPGRLHG